MVTFLFTKVKQFYLKKFKISTTYEKTVIAVEPEQENLTEIILNSYSNCIEDLKRIHGNIMFSSIRKEQKINVQYGKHPVFEGFVSAYKCHRPITISPDIFWLLISQAFSNHVSNNHEKLRHMFVNFSGKTKLKVTRKDLNFYTMNSEDWETIFPEFVSQISNYTGKDITDTLKPEFTTTTPVSLAVGQLMIMSTMKHYFDYLCEIEGCGFPHITIEGSIEDWTKIADKLSKLSKYKFEWFTKQTIPVINKIIDTKKGIVDDIFWKIMLKVKNSSGFYNPGYVNGWLCRFFPFDSKGNRLNGRVDDEDELQSELQEIPFILNIIGQESYNCEFLAGFVGLSQDEETKSVKPEIGWFIRTAEKKDSEDSDEVNENDADNEDVDFDDDGDFDNGKDYNDFNAIYNANDDDKEEEGFDELFS